MSSQTVAKPKKGILKKPSSSPAPAPAPAPSARDVAIQHAHIIQQRREVVDSISDSLIILSKLPSGSTDTDTTTTSNKSQKSNNTSSESPSASDVETFKTHVRLFQPSDYDDLIEERNARGACGYVLCGRPRRRVTQGGDWKLLNFGRADFAIVPKAELQRWCARGRDCARRAMYVKVQLHETAAWERAGIDGIRIELLEDHDQAQSKADGENDAATRLARELDGLKVEADKKAAKDARDLALERGDADEGKAKDHRVDVTIREKKVLMAAEEPSLAKDQEGHMILDGYKTKFDPKSDTIKKAPAAAEAEKNAERSAEEKVTNEE